MPFTREIQPSIAKMEALAAEIKDISSHERFLLRPVLEALLSLIETSTDALPVEILRKLLSQRKSPRTVENVLRPVLPILTSFCG
jgi:hypothetical protein